MRPDPASATSLTLLGRLRQVPADAAAWNDFVQRYGRQIYRWCRRWNLQDADAEDVTQTVLLALSEKMRDFAYDPSGKFRAWLKTVAYHAWSKFVSGRQQRARGSGDSGVVELLETVEARDDLAARLEEEFDRELLEQAVARVRQRVQPHTWDVFHLLTFEGLSGADVARRLNMQVASVFAARSKVQRMLQEEIRKMEEAG